MRHVRVSAAQIDLTLNYSQIVGVSPNIATLTRLTSLRLNDNALTELPAGVTDMTRLSVLLLNSNALSLLPPDIGRLRSLTTLFVQCNSLTRIPRDIGLLTALSVLQLANNRLNSVPAELADLGSLRSLVLESNELQWLPFRLTALPTNCDVRLHKNRFPVSLNLSAENARVRLGDIVDATINLLAVIREPATTLAIGLQDLELPALVTLEIVDAALPNLVPMHLKWNLIVAVKHFRDRANKR